MIVCRILKLDFIYQDFHLGPASVVYPYSEPSNDIRKRNFGHLIDSQEKIITVDDNGKIRTSLESSPLEYQGVLKKTPSTSIHGMRTIKSLSGDFYFLYLFSNLNFIFN